MPLSRLSIISGLSGPHHAYVLTVQEMHTLSANALQPYIEVLRSRPLYY